MKSTDVVRSFDQNLFVRFSGSGETGTVSMLNLGRGLSVIKEGLAVCGRYHDSRESFRIEQFVTDASATAAFRKLQASIERYSRGRRLSSFGRRAVKWLVLPAGLLVLALTLHAGVMQSRQASNNTIAASEEEQVVATAAHAPLQPRTTVDHGQVTSFPAAQVAQAMSDGVKAGTYSIKLSSGTKGDVFVFADPLCSACQTLEKHLEDIGADYSVHVFPVSIIGGKASDAITSAVLSLEPGQRAKAWRKAINGDDDFAPSTAAGIQALNANNKIFRALNLDATPTLISHSGSQLRHDAPFDAMSLRRWLASDVSRDK